MSEVTAFFLALAALFLLLAYGFALLKVRQQRIPRHQRYEAIAASDPAFPRAVLAAIEVRGNALTAAGFRLCGMITYTRPEGHTVYGAMFEWPDGSITASVLAAVRRGRAAPARIVVNLASEFADGLRVGTNDAVLNTLGRIAPDTEMHRFPGLADIGRLVAAHRKIIAGHGAVTIPRLPGNVPAAFFAVRVDAEMERQVALGTMRLDGDSYRMTLMGAALAVWRLVPPSAFVIALIYGIQAQWELKELGV
jgi:hypothetical protein